ncbi:MAG: thiol reductant ABC exporter subunit CydC [Pseudomonadota bacterium]
MRAIRQIIRRQATFDRFHFWIGILVALLPAAAGILLLGVSGWFITAAAIAGLSGAFLNIFAPSAIIRALAIVRTAGRYGERLLTHDATFRFLGDLRNRLFALYASTALQGRRSGLLLNRLTADIAALDAIYLRLVVPGAVAVVVLICLLLFWASVSLPVLLVGFCCALAWVSLAVLSFVRPDKNSARRADAASEAMRLRAADLAAGRRDLAIYGGLDLAADEVIDAGHRLQQAEDRLDKRAAATAAASNLVGQTFLAAMLVVGLLAVSDGSIGLAFAVGLVLVAIALPEIISLMLAGFENLPRMSLAAGRAVAVEELSVGRTKVRTDGPDPEPCAGNILRFQGVSFRYDGAVNDVIGDLSFDIGPGEIVAIAGRSGCGKSTVAALAARLIFARKGLILLNGCPIEDYREDLLRRAVTVVSQRPYLFNDTLAANLRLADAQASEADLWQALDRSALSERIAAGKDGLAAILGEGGLGLSGGEQRRLALARAFLTRPALFVLDEMTEGLDDRTAEDVLGRFMGHRGSSSVLMIAHKQRELDAADRVLHL